MYAQRLPNWHEHKELARLSDLPRPPKFLYYQGDWNPMLFTKCTAIIGSRRMTDYGRRVIEKIIPRLVFEKKTVISGFMYGVDQYAHEVCLKNGGKTIAVLGWGIERELDGQDKRLAEDIVSSGGLILSEWDTQRATLWTFPVRNRIVAALSSDVIVVEAAIKSGSMITVGIASALKRVVWAVPGPITSSLSTGTNLLIAQGKARMWVGDSRGLQKVAQDPLLRALGDDALTVDELARSLGAPVSEIGAQLSMLTLTGDVVEQGGKYYVGKN